LPPAYGQPYSEEGDEQPRTPNYDGRDVTLSFNVTHHGIKPGDDELEHTTLKISIYDNKTGNTVKNVTLFATIFANDSSQLFREAFFAEEGLLVFDLAAGPELTIQAEKEDFLQAYVPGSDGRITLTSPDWTPGGRYGLYIEIMGWDSIENLFSPDYSIKSNFNWDEKDVVDETVTVPEFSVAGFIIALTLGAVISVTRVRKLFTSS
jgi:hypothetical protein